MDQILIALNESRQSTLFPLAQSVALLLMCFVQLVIGMAVSREDIRTDVRSALRHAGITHKAAAIDMGISEGLLSRKLSGDKPLTFESLEPLDAIFWQWFAVLTAQRHGVPATVTAGARLARRQARMALPLHAKAGVA